MARRWLWVVTLAACRFTPGAPPAGTGDATIPDTRPIDGGGGADASACFDVDGVTLQVCLKSSPSGQREITSSLTIDTGMAMMCDALAMQSGPACVLSGDTVHVAAGVTLTAHGNKVLVLFGNSITIDGTIDVSSHGTQLGPLANITGCQNGTNPAGRGGGAGGSFGTQGGAGGDENAQNNHGIAGGTVALFLRGGCKGQNGGTSGGTGGAGGGAVILVATQITVNGAIDASGAGGKGAATNSTRGGGGGGSGGLIILQAPTVHTGAAAQIFANGGGGGGGTNNQTAGTDGDDPADATTRPSGGVGGGAAGDGGDGFYTTHPPTVGLDGTNGTDGGGGGGGGAGFVHVPAGTQILGFGSISPAPL